MLIMFRNRFRMVVLIMYGFKIELEKKWFGGNTNMKRVSKYCNIQLEIKTIHKRDRKD